MQFDGLDGTISKMITSSIRNELLCKIAGSCNYGLVNEHLFFYTKNTAHSRGHSNFLDIGSRNCKNRRHKMYQRRSNAPSNLQIKSSASYFVVYQEERTRSIGEIT